MKVKNRLGEFYFKALVQFHRDTKDWTLTAEYFGELKDVVAAFPGKPVKWPIEQMDDTTVYWHTEDELDESL